MNKMTLPKSTGFTLVELLIALVIGSLVIGAVYSSLQSQHASYLAQDQVVEMQQNLRAAMNIMAREIRMAGYDPTLLAWREPTPPSVLMAAARQLQISMDSNENGVVVDPDPNPPNSEPNEIVAFGFASGIDVKPADGIVDNGVANLGRNTGAGFQPIAENIHALGFAYAFDADGNGVLDFNDLNNNGVQEPGETTIWAVDSDGDGAWDDLDSNGDGFIDGDDLPALAGGVPPPVQSIAGADTGIAMHPEDVRAVRVWLLARASQPDNRYINTTAYVVGRQIVTVKDHFRRRLLETVVDCRNMGLVRQ